MVVPVIAAQEGMRLGAASQEVQSQSSPIRSATFLCSVQLAPGLLLTLVA